MGKIKHSSVGVGLTQAEWESDTIHVKGWDTEIFLSAGEAGIATGTSGVGGMFAVVYAAANSAMDIGFSLKVPDDFVSFTRVDMIWQSPAASGNAYIRCRAYYAAADEVNSTHSDLPNYVAYTTAGASKINVENTGLTLGSLTVGDYIGFEFQRNGAHANDTLDDIFQIIGLTFVYSTS